MIISKNYLKVLTGLPVYAHSNSALFGITFKNVKIKHFGLFFDFMHLLLPLFHIFRANADFFSNI